MSWPVPIKGSALPTWNRLQAELVVTPVPCTGRDEWISDLPEVRQFAAGHCGRCPLLALCNDYADAAGERSNVWGGKDRTPRASRTATTIPLFPERTSA